MGVCTAPSELTERLTNDILRTISYQHQDSHSNMNRITTENQQAKHRTTNKRNNRTTNKRNNRTINKRNNRTTNKRNNRTTKQPNNRTTQQPNNRTTEQPNNRTTNLQWRYYVLYILCTLIGFFRYTLVFFQSVVHSLVVVCVSVCACVCVGIGCLGVPSGVGEGGCFCVRVRERRYLCKVMLIFVVEGFQSFHQHFLVCVCCCLFVYVCMYVCMCVCACVEGRCGRTEDTYTRSHSPTPQDTTGTQSTKPSYPPPIHTLIPTGLPDANVPNSPITYSF